MNFQKTTNGDGSVEFKFQSKNISGSPIGLLFFVVPASVYLVVQTLSAINPNFPGGALFSMVAVGSVVLSVAAYQLAKTVLFVRSHTVKTVGSKVIFDGKEVSRKEARFGVTRKDEQASIYVKEGGQERKVTGWMNADRAEEVTAALY